MAETATDTTRIWQCPDHGLIEPKRFDSDWPDDDGEVCPVLGTDENACGKALMRRDPIELLRVGLRKMTGLAGAESHDENELFDVKGIIQDAITALGHGGPHRIGETKLERDARIATEGLRKIRLQDSLTRENLQGEDLDSEISPEEALLYINDIRNSIVGLQTFNWSATPTGPARTAGRSGGRGPRRTPSTSRAARTSATPTTRTDVRDLRQMWRLAPTAGHGSVEAHHRVGRGVSAAPTPPRPEATPMRRRAGDPLPMSSKPFYICPSLGSIRGPARPDAPRASPGGRERRRLHAPRRPDPRHRAPDRHLQRVRLRADQDRHGAGLGGVRPALARDASERGLASRPRAR